MTVDKILATGRYTDRQGRKWSRAREGWTDFDLRTRTITFLRPHHMRLLIERDQHRGECDGLIDCGDHPVPVVEIDGPVTSRTGCYYVRGPKSWKRVGHKHDLESAMDAAYKLAVSSD